MAVTSPSAVTLAVTSPSAVTLAVTSPTAVAVAVTSPPATVAWAGQPDHGAHFFLPLPYIFKAWDAITTGSLAFLRVPNRAVQNGLELDSFQYNTIGFLEHF